MIDDINKTRPPVPALMPFYYVMVVWGEDYVGMLLDVALPSFLSPRNLPALSNLAESRFLILTTAEDRARIEQSPIFAQLRAVIEPQFVESEWIHDPIPYHLKAARGHRVAAHIAGPSNGYCVYLCPDCIVSDGSFSHLERIARTGKQAVLMPGLRLVKESVLAELADAGKLQPGAPINFSARELAAFGMRHLHDEVRRYNWDHTHFATYPHMCTWTVPGETGLLIRAFGMHPMLVAVGGTQNFDSLERSTIDGDFIGNNITDWEQIHVETDSDNLLIFSLTNRDERYSPLKSNTANVEQVRAMAYSASVNPLHRYFFTKGVKLHAGPLNDTWTSVDRASASMVYPILSFGPDDANYLTHVPARNLAVELGTRVRRRAIRALQKLLR